MNVLELLYLGQSGAMVHMWHPLGHLSSESGAQQGDPLGPLCIALALQRIISVVDMDGECIEMLCHAWFF